MSFAAMLLGDFIPSQARRSRARCQAFGLPRVYYHAGGLLWVLLWLNGKVAMAMLTPMADKGKVAIKGDPILIDHYGSNINSALKYRSFKG